MEGISERIKMARRMAGLSMRGLAEAADVSAMAISKYERGLDIPGSAVLIRLARALDVKVEFLLRPVNGLALGLSAPSFRKRASLSVRKGEAVQARVQEWLERYLAIEGLFGDAVAFELPADLDRRVTRPDDIEEVALNLREAWRLGWDPIESMAEVLEDHGVKVGAIKGYDAFDALTLWANEVTPVIVTREGLPGDRQRFDLAHELGHLVLAPAGDMDGWRKGAQEKAAQRFAGAFLVPAPKARFELGQHRATLDLMELHLLKHKYGMSMQAWVYRAKDLGIISEAYATQLHIQFRRNGWHRDEPGDPIPPEKPARLDRLVLRALAEDVISESRAAELIGMPMAQFWQRMREQHAGFPAVLHS